MAKRSKKYQEALKLVDRTKRYSLEEAVELVKKTSVTKFDATVECAVRLNIDPRKAEQNLRGAVSLPNGTGKTVRVLVITKGAKIEEALKAGADYAGEAEYLEKWKKGFRSWRTTLAKEHSPCYDYAYTLTTGDEIDMERAANYFYRCPPSRLASGVTIDRKDYPMQTRFSGTTKELSSLLPADERFIAKYDRNPMAYCAEDSGGMYCVESCFVYTFAYWTGRYYGLIGSEE